MKNNYKVAVLGPIPYDHITTSNGTVIIKYGCATHPTIALAKLLAGRGEVWPVSHTRKKDAPEIKALLQDYENVMTATIFDEMDQGDVIQLRFVDQNNRLEKQTAFMPPIRPHDVDLVLDADAFVCVPISDYEVPLDTLQYIKEYRTNNGLIIFDAHGPTTAVTTTGDRVRRFWIERDLWLPSIDILKMNIEEASCCWFKKAYEPSELEQEYRDLTEEEMMDFGRHVLSFGVQALYITLDSRGCMIFSKENGQVKAEFVASVRVDEVIDTTGCGDAFAGGLAYGFLEDHADYIRAAQFANALGARRTQGTSFEVFQSLELTNELIRHNYGEAAKV
mgnify:CR=1 FL=1